MNPEITELQEEETAIVDSHHPTQPETSSESARITPQNPETLASLTPQGAAAAAPPAEERDNSLPSSRPNLLSQLFSPSTDSGAISKFIARISRATRNETSRATRNETSRATRNETSSDHQSNDTIYKAKCSITEEYYYRKHTGECVLDVNHRDKVFFNMITIIENTNVLLSELISIMDNLTNMNIQKQISENPDIKIESPIYKKRQSSPWEKILTRRKTTFYTEEMRLLLIHITYTHSKLSFLEGTPENAINKFLLLNPVNKDIEIFRQMFEKKCLKAQRKNTPNKSKDFLNEDSFNVFREILQNYSQVLGLVINVSNTELTKNPSLLETINSDLRDTTMTNRSVHHTIDILKLAKEIILSLHARSFTLGKTNEYQKCDFNRHKHIMDIYTIDDHLISTNPGSTILDFHAYSLPTITHTQLPPNSQSLKDFREAYDAFKNKHIRENNNRLVLYDVPPVYNATMYADSLNRPSEEINHTELERERIGFYQTLEELSEPPVYEDVVPGPMNSAIIDIPSSARKKVTVKITMLPAHDYDADDVRKNMTEDDVPPAYSTIDEMDTYSNRRDFRMRAMESDIQGETEPPQAAPPSYDSLQVNHQDIGDISNDGRQVR